MSPSSDAEAIISIEGAGMTVEDMNVDQSTTGGTSTIIVEGVFAVGPSGASEPAPEEEEPALGEEPEGLTPEEPAPAPASAEEPSLTPEEPTFEVPEEDGAMTEEEPSDEDEMKPERTLEEGFFNAVTFSPAEGSWVSVAIEGTGMTVQGMFVNQMMEGEDTFRVTVEVTLAHEGAIAPDTTTPEVPIEPALPSTVTPEGVPTTPAVASLTVTPSTAAAGSLITVEGTGFEAAQQIDISIDGTEARTQPSTITADGVGNFVAIVIVPDGTAPGEQEISVSDSAGNTGTSSHCRWNSRRNNTGTRDCANRTASNATCT